MATIKNYEEALTYIDGLAKFASSGSLARIEKLLELLGNPEKSFEVIHVGGTNGKGSVVTTIAQVLVDQGYCVGQFISPEIINFRERIAVNNGWITEEELVSLVNIIESKIKIFKEVGLEEPTQFDVLTALALLHFKEKGVSLGVIEVGMGGAVDSTNIVTPLLSIITNVSLDHQKFLGNKVSVITKVKSGIIKNEIPIILGTDDKEVLQVIEEEAALKGSKVLLIDRDFAIRDIKTTDKGTEFFFSNKDLDGVKCFYSLRGYHQGKNAGVSIEALCLLKELGYKVDLRRTINFLASVSWPGRLEKINHEGYSIILDGAHNRVGIESLVKSLKGIYPKEKLVLVLSMFRDKDIKEMLEELETLGATIIITQTGNERDWDINEVGLMTEGYPVEVIIEKSLEKAIEKGLSKAGMIGVLCISGSLQIVRQGRKYFKGGMINESR